MRRFLLLLFVSVNFCAAAQQDLVDTVGFRQLVQKVAKAYAPDKRSVYFNTTQRGDSVFIESTSSEALQVIRNEAANMRGIKFSATLLPAKSLNELYYGVVNLSVANNRVNPQHAAEMATQMIMGTPVEVLKRQGGYYLVRTPDGYLSWTDGAAIRLMDKTQFTAWKVAEKVVFTTDYGSALKAASFSAPRVSDLVAGNMLQLLATEGEFYKVAFPDKRTGYIARSTASLYADWIKRPKANAADILNAAHNFVGIPYLWGGTSVKGMDCSGFTKTAYFLNGIVIPRDASQQALVGEQVAVLAKDTLDVVLSLKNLLPGDLLFFSAAKSRGINGGRITHTAIYMGNGQYIHAAGMVRISSFVPQADDYDRQSTTIVGARRLLTVVGQKEITQVSEHPWYQ